ncbi:hypothetical protein PSPO01_06066 [Paraphaeosphaeria sporulosa]
MWNLWKNAENGAGLWEGRVCGERDVRSRTSSAPKTPDLGLMVAATPSRGRRGGSESHDSAPSLLARSNALGPQTTASAVASLLVADGAYVAGVVGRRARCGTAASEAWADVTAAVQFLVLAARRALRAFDCRCWHSNRGRVWDPRLAAAACDGWWLPNPSSAQCLTTARVVCFGLISPTRRLDEMLPGLVTRLAQGGVGTAGWRPLSVNALEATPQAVRWALLLPVSTDLKLRDAGAQTSTDLLADPGSWRLRRRS